MTRLHYAMDVYKYKKAILRGEKVTLNDTIYPKGVKCAERYHIVSCM